MNILIPLAATAAVLVLTWFSCIRPMRRNNAGTASAGCCAAPSGRPIEEQIRDATQELQNLQATTPGTAEERSPSGPSRRES